uniref:Uncharacterized protein n=1 Tax=Aegilops tauschii subsp. strangulata TaxID=200361 RepID=A0A453KQ64_AEGTS
MPELCSCFLLLQLDACRVGDFAVCRSAVLSKVKKYCPDSDCTSLI